jgi:hypothetical protein
MVQFGITGLTETGRRTMISGTITLQIIQVTPMPMIGLRAVLALADRLGR